MRRSTPCVVISMAPFQVVVSRLIGRTSEYGLAAGCDSGARHWTIDDVRRHDPPRPGRHVDLDQVPPDDDQRASAIDRDARSNGIANRDAGLVLAGTCIAGLAGTAVTSIVLVCRDDAWSVHEQGHGQKRAVRDGPCASSTEPERSRDEADRAVLPSAGHRSWEVTTL
jgi:hypothetical protein